MDPKMKDISNLIQQRMDALEKGDLSNCDGCIVTFLVGPEPDGDEIVVPTCEMRACKFDLMVASEYFAGLLRSPFTQPGPIRLRHVDPAIFKLVIEYTHACGRLVSKVEDVEHCLKLSAAADEFLLEGLGQMCTELLEKFISTENVWNIFTENHMIKFTSRACLQLLSAKTSECLEMPAFLDICEEALIKFLQLNKMKIESEMELVRACIKYVDGKEDERDIFRRSALPHLRLLLLNADEFVEITPFINIDEKVFLALDLSQQDPLSIKTEFSDRVSLSKERARRHLLVVPPPRKKMMKILLPLEDKGILDIETMVEEGRFVKLRSASKFILTFSTQFCLKITGFDILCPFDWNFFKSDSPVRLKSKQMSKWDDTTVLKVSVSAGGFDETSGPLKPKELVDSWVHFKTSIIVPKDSTFRMEVIFNSSCYIRRVLAKDTSNPNYFQQYYDDNIKPKFHLPNWQKTSETLSIFKSVYYNE